MNQPILEGVLPILSTVFGNKTVAGLMAIVNLAVDHITTTTDSFEFQSKIMNTIAMVFSTINSIFASLTSSETPLTTYILLALLSYVAFLVVYGVVSWVVRSVLNLIKLSIIITIVTTLLWFIINVTSPLEGNGAGTDSDAFKSGKQQHRHQDPISKLLHSFQHKFRTEYERQQQHLQNPHVY
ncbi:hypothetical protein BGX27_005964 [Mortierella sp. AM989]|nr:hypothetical protein BGX27_005964 [Mortierella sp. AM989]